MILVRLRIVLSDAFEKKKKKPLKCKTKKEKEKRT
jgi:hypothetical protein